MSSDVPDEESTATEKILQLVITNNFCSAPSKASITDCCGIVGWIITNKVGILQETGNVECT